MATLSHKWPMVERASLCAAGATIEIPVDRASGLAFLLEEMC